MGEIINEKQDPSERYDKHKEWRTKNKKKLSAQNKAKRDNDKKLNKLPGRKQGAMEAGREAVRCAKERGDLVQPDNCEMCGKESKRLIFHHAHGYSPDAQLEGEFLCDTCHAEVDNNKGGDHTVDGPVRGPRKGMEKVHGKKKGEGQSDSHKTEPEKTNTKEASHSDNSIIAKLNASILGHLKEGVEISPAPLLLEEGPDRLVSDIASLITDDPDVFN